MTAVYIRKIRLDGSQKPAELAVLRSTEVRKLLTDCLCEHYGECAAAWVLKKNQEGKPYLSSPDAALVPPYISLSHSGEWVVCALSDQPVGVDVQTVQTISNAVFARFCPGVKTGYDDRFNTQLWTNYEACLKRYGNRSEMVTDALGQRYDSIDLDNAVVTVCHGNDEPEWIHIPSAFPKSIE